MDNLRLILIAALCFIGLQLYLAWQVDYGRRPLEPNGAATEVDQSERRRADFTPPGNFISSSRASLMHEATTTPESSAVSAAQGISVITDVLELTIDPLGGEIDRAALRSYAVASGEPRNPFVLLDRDSDQQYYIQGGLLAETTVPDHRSQYSSAQTHYELSADAEFLEVVLTWRSDSGLTVEKIFTVTRGSYEIGIDYRIQNESSTTWSGSTYTQAQRRDIRKRSVVNSFNGIAISSAEDRYQKYDFDELTKSDIDQEIINGWAALIQHYFIVALLPASDAPYRYYSRVLDEERYLVGLVSPTVEVAPGETREIGSRLYLGPKLQHVLPSIATGLDLTVDYGVFWLIAKPLFWLLERVHDATGNWGWAIIGITILLKILFYPLQDKAYRSMARMRKLQPRMMAIKERYGDDRQRMNTAMMELYRTEKFNPLGGCLPTLLQIPVFIALYWVLLESVEMRQATFILWLNDLSSPDRFFVLPVLMGITMFFSQKLNPAPVDPVQAKVMQILPVVFTVFYAFLPSGLVLYWTMQSVLSLAQQWFITRRIEASPA